MPLSQKEKDKRTAIRTRKLLDAEHRNHPITYWGTFHCLDDYDLSKLRRDMSDACRRGKMPPTFVKIEQSRHGRRPHLHFLWHNNPDRRRLRGVFAQLLARQQIASDRFRFAAERIRSVKAVFAYLSKATTNYTTQSRTTLSIGHFFHKPTTDILKKTPAQLWTSKIEYIANDPVTFFCVWQGVVTREQLANPRWLSYWRRKERLNQEPYVPEEWRDSPL